MIKLVALKKLHYPSGPSGKEYIAGQDFEALSENDASALTKVRAAKYPDTPSARPHVNVPPPPLQTRAMEPVAEPEKPRDELFIEQGTPPTAPGRRYNRRDQRATED